MFDYKVATEKELEIIWNKDISSHPNDGRWVVWKEQYISYNKTGKATTFVVLKNDNPIGQITILFSPECNAVKNKPFLCDGKTIANMNAFRIEKQFEGQHHISKLVKIGEEYAKQKGIKTLTIGVEEENIRNTQIYFHFGYTKFLEKTIEDGENILYYSKDI